MQRLAHAVTAVEEAKSVKAKKEAYGELLGVLSAPETKQALQDSFLREIGSSGHTRRHLSASQPITHISLSLMCS
jgi:hypothetical protein